MFQTTPLSQRDVAWNSYRLGYGSCKIGTDGCLLTAFTMLAQHDNVETENEYRKIRGGFSGAYATTYDLLGSTKTVTCISPRSEWQLRYEKIAYPDTERYQEHLDAGQPAIVEVNWYKRFMPWLGWAYRAMHFVLAMPNGDVYDPWPQPNENKSVCSLLDYGKSPEEAIVRVIYYKEY